MKIRVPTLVLAGLRAFSGGVAAEAGETTLYIVRHGKTMPNTTDRVQGWSDAVLTPEGEAVMKTAGRGLKDVIFQAVYRSHSGRALQMARLILAESKAPRAVPLATDPRLRELNFGAFEGDLNKTMWSAGVADIGKADSARGEGNTLVVSHGLSIMALLDTLFADFKAPPGGLENASVTIMKVKNGPIRWKRSTTSASSRRAGTAGRQDRRRNSRDAAIGAPGSELRDHVGPLFTKI